MPTAPERIYQLPDGTYVTRATLLERSRTATTSGGAVLVAVEGDELTDEQAAAYGITPPAPAEQPAAKPAAKKGK